MSVFFLFLLLFLPLIDSVPENGTEHPSSGNNQTHFDLEQVSRSIDLADAPNLGILQIPYSGLTTRSLTLSFSERLGLDDKARGALITDITPGSPAESLGLRPMNLSRIGSAEEIIASRGDIILAVDGSASFNTEYQSIEQYIIQNKRVGEKITLNILRDGQPKDVEMIIRAKPAFLWYENADSGVRIKYPSDWHLVKEKNQTEDLVARFHSAEKSSLANLPVIEASLFTYSSEYNDSSSILEPNTERGDKAFRILDFNTGKLGNSTAYTALFYDYSKNNQTRKVFTVFTERDSLLYNVNFSIDSTKYDDYLPLIMEMTKSFQFTK